jgi:hypothetical protein
MLGTASRLASGVSGHLSVPDLSLGREQASGTCGDAAPSVPPLQGTQIMLKGGVQSPTVLVRTHDGTGPRMVLRSGRHTWGPGPLWGLATKECPFSMVVGTLRTPLRGSDGYMCRSEFRLRGPQTYGRSCRLLPLWDSWRWWSILGKQANWPVVSYGGP